MFQSSGIQTDVGRKSLRGQCFFQVKDEQTIITMLQCDSLAL